MADRIVRGNRVPPPPRRKQPPVPRKLPPNELLRMRAQGSAVRRDASRRKAPDLSVRVRIVLGIAVAVICVSVVLVGVRLLGPAVNGAGDFLAGLAGSAAQLVGASPSHSPVVPDAPRLVQPATAYTNKGTLDVHGYAPSSEVGQPDRRIRIYVRGVQTAEASLGTTLDFVVPGVPLPSGHSDISATIVSPSGESAHSDPINITYDAAPPPLTIATPRNGAVVSGDRVRVTGTTQANALVSVRNLATGQTSQAVAAGGKFAVDVQLDSGANSLVVTATDPAGNTKAVRLSVTRSASATTVHLSVTPKSLRIADLPQQVSMNVTVTDPDGGPVNGATVDFGLSPPGLPTTTFEVTTAGGKASWTTTVPREGATAGSALVTVLVTLPDGTEFREAAVFEFV